MAPIILFIATGILTGYLLRNSKLIKHNSNMMSGVIMILLFFMGVSVGSNEQVVNNIATIGLDALILTAGGTLGSLFAAKWIYKRFFKQ